MYGVSYSNLNGGLFNFTGSTNSYVNVGNAVIFDSITDGITLEAWVKPSTFVNNFQRFISKQYSIDYSTVNSCFQLGIHNTNTWRWSVGGQFDTYISTPAPIANNWYHIVGTYDKVNSKIYVNGVGVYTSALYTGALKTNSSQIVTIGTSDWTGSRAYSYTGAISFVSIYRRAITGSEVLQKFNMLKARYGL